MEIKETSRFSRIVNKYLSEDEYAELCITLIASPALGVVIPGTGGIRKLRWKAAGRGKRGGSGNLLLADRSRANLVIDDFLKKRTGKYINKKTARPPEKD